MHDIASTNQSTAATTNGWCYIDDLGRDRSIGQPQWRLRLALPRASEQRDVQASSAAGQPESGSTVFITCEGQWTREGLGFGGSRSPPVTTLTAPGPSRG